MLCVFTGYHLPSESLPTGRQAYLSAGRPETGDFAENNSIFKWAVHVGDPNCFLKSIINKCFANSNLEHQHVESRATATIVGRCRPILYITQILHAFARSLYQQLALYQEISYRLDDGK